MGSGYKEITEVQFATLVGRMDAYEFSHKKTLFMTRGRAKEYMAQMFSFKKQYRTHFRAKNIKSLGFSPSSNNGKTETIDQIKLLNYITSVDSNFIDGSEATRDGIPTLTEKVGFISTTANDDETVQYSGTRSVSIWNEDPVANTFMIKKIDLFNVEETEECEIYDQAEPDSTTVTFKYRKTSDSSDFLSVRYSSNMFDSSSLIITYNVDDGYGVVKRYIIAEHGELPVYETEAVKIMPIVPLKENNNIIGIDPDTKEPIINTESDDYFKEVARIHDDKADLLEADFLTLLNGYGNEEPYEGKVYVELDIDIPSFQDSDTEFKNSLKNLYDRRYFVEFNGFVNTYDNVAGTNATQDFLDAYGVRRAEYDNEIKFAKDTYKDSDAKRLERSHRRFMRSINLNYDDFEKTVGNDQLDSLYIMIGVDMMSEYEAAIGIIFDYFSKFSLNGVQEIEHSQLKVTYNFRAESGTAPGKLIADLDYEFHLEDLDGNTVPMIELTGTAIDKDKKERDLVREGWIHEDTVQGDYGYIKNKRSWKQKGWITEIKLVERTNEPVEAGSADRKTIGRYAFYHEIIEGHTWGDETTEDVHVLRYYKQIDSSTVAYLYIHDFTQTYSFGFGANQISGVNSRSGSAKHDFESFRIVPHIDAFKKLKYKDFEAVYEESLVMLAYSYDKIKLKWYQTSWFKAIMQVISVALMAYGSIGNIVANGASSAAAIAFELGKSIIINALIGYAVIEIATHVGGVAGIALATAAGIVLGGTANGFESNLTSILNSSLNYLDKAVKAQLSVVIADTRSMIEGYDEKLKQLKEESDGYGYGMLDSDSIADVMRNWNSDLDSYFVVHTSPNKEIYNPFQAIEMSRSIQPILDAAYAPLDLDQFRKNTLM